LITPLPAGKARIKKQITQIIAKSTKAYLPCRQAGRAFGAMEAKRQQGYKRPQGYKGHTLLIALMP